MSRSAVAAGFLLATLGLAEARPVTLDPGPARPAIGQLDGPQAAGVPTPPDDSYDAITRRLAEERVAPAANAADLDQGIRRLADYGLAVTTFFAVLMVLAFFRGIVLFIRSKLRRSPVAEASPLGSDAGPLPSRERASTLPVRAVALRVDASARTAAARAAPDDPETHPASLGSVILSAESIHSETTGNGGRVRLEPGRVQRRGQSATGDLTVAPGRRAYAFFCQRPPSDCCQ